MHSSCGWVALYSVAARGVDVITAMVNGHVIGNAIHPVLSATVLNTDARMILYTVNVLPRSLTHTGFTIYCAAIA